MLYQIHRYPAELIDVVRLAGGQRVVVRPVLPQDEALTGRLLRRPAGAGALRPLPEPDAQPAAGPDQALHQHRLLPITWPWWPRCSRMAARPWSPRRGTRAARTDRRPSSPSRWPTHWQGQGLASLLLGKLAAPRRRPPASRRMIGETLATNDKMLHLARKAGFTITAQPRRARRDAARKAARAPRRRRTPCNDAVCSVRRGLTAWRHLRSRQPCRRAGEGDHGRDNEPQRRRQQHEEHQHRGECPHGQRRKDDGRADQPDSAAASRPRRPNR